MRDIDSRQECYRGVRVIVLGASGFVGQWVARTLCARGAQLHLVVRHQAAARRILSAHGVRGDIYEHDLRRAEAIRPLFQQLRPAITFNLAGYGVDRSEREEGAAYQINASVVQAVCTAAAESRDAQWTGQAIVHVGSALEYGTINGNLHEDSVPRPTTLYGKSKLAGTQLLTQGCRSHEIRGVTARLFTVYGPGEHDGRLLPSLLETAQTGAPLELTAGQQKRDFTYVEDVAEGLVRLGLSTTARPGEIVNLATGRLTSVRDFTEMAAEVLRIPSDCLRFGAIPTRAEEMIHTEVSLRRFRRLTAWTPLTSIAEGLRRTLSFESATL